MNALSKARAASTNKVYDGKWSLFKEFCAARGHSPELADSPLVADFLIHLFHSRKLTARTIATYRSAIGNVLRFTTSYDPGEDRVLTLLLKGFERQRKPLDRRVPSWDLGLVLRYLAQPQHANAKLDLHTLTAKAVFLLSLASAGRCQSLAALENRLTVVSEDPLVIQIPYHSSYVPKQFYRTKVRQPILPFRLTALPSGENDALCPVETIFHYQQRVAARRGVGQSSLFIPHPVGKVGRMHPAAVGRYVVKLILSAYETMGMFPPKGVRAHDVRGVATSLRALTGIPLAEVLAAGQWSSSLTFARFYLKEFPPSQIRSIRRAPTFMAAGGMVASTSEFFQR